MLSSARHPPHKLCFEKKICPKVTQEIRNYFHELNKMQQFTFVLLTNKALNTMPAEKLHKMLTSTKKGQSFLKKHVFLGLIDHHAIKSKQLVVAASLDDQHPLVEMVYRDTQNDVIIRNGNHVDVIEKTIYVREGVVHIVAPLK